MYLVVNKNLSEEDNVCIGVGENPPLIDRKVTENVQNYQLSILKKRFSALFLG